MIDNLFCRKFLRKYGYKTTPTGMSAILNEWAKNKKDLLVKFRTHPNWNEDALAIVIPNTEYQKVFSSDSLENFERWANSKVPVIKKTKASEEISERIYINKLDDLRAMIRYSMKNDKKILVDGEKLEDINEKAKKEYDDYKEKVKDLIKIEEDDEKAYYITETFKENIDEVLNALRYITNNVRNGNINAEQATTINEKCNVGAADGQKISRVINKLCTKIGLNEINETATTTNDEGEEITRQVGYQHHFNVMAEQVTNQTYKVHTVISLNPVDYWAMSLGKKWASCMSIDKLNIGNRNNHYSGMYSSGTESYMLDGSTVVFYTIAEDYNGNFYCLQDKLNRCLFSIGKDGNNILQHKVYPDARDGGDLNKAQYYRNVMQEVISQIYENENQWTLKRGSSYCRDWTTTIGTHYSDYSCDSSCNVSVLKGKEYEATKIKVGHDPICPVCGRTHRTQNCIMDYDCERMNYKREYAIYDIFEQNKELEDENENPIIENLTNTTITEEAINNAVAQEVEENGTVFCAHCGAEIDIEDALELNGNYFCDDECAENEGWHYINDEYIHEDDADLVETVNEGWQYEADCFEDYNGNWYLGEPEVRAEDGTLFASVDDAFDSDYDHDEDGYWYHVDDMYWSEERQCYIHHDDCIEMNDGNYFADEEDAENHGYRQTTNGDWLNEDEVFFDEYDNEYHAYDDEEVIEINNEYYGSSESAEASGYVEINGTWYREDDVLYDEYSETHFTKDEAEVHTEDDNYFLYETSAIVAGYRETENGWILNEEARESA